MGNGRGGRGEGPCAGAQLCSFQASLRSLPCLVLFDCCLLSPHCIKQENGPDSHSSKRHLLKTTIIAVTMQDAGDKGGSTRDRVLAPWAVGTSLGRAVTVV